MAKKKFLEVFQQIKLNPKTEDYFSDVYVTNVIYWKNSKMLSVDIESGHLIPKAFIEEAERSIGRLCFDKDYNSVVEIKERYLLSGQYNAKNLMELYMDSILYDLRRMSYINAELIKSAEISVDDSTINLRIPASELATERMIEIRRFLEDVFLQRFGMNVVVNIRLVQKEEQAEKEEEKDGGAAAEASSQDEYYAEMAAEEAAAEET